MIVNTIIAIITNNFQTNAIFQTTVTVVGPVDNSCHFTAGVALNGLTARWLAIKGFDEDEKPALNFPIDHVEIYHTDKREQPHFWCMH